MSARFCFDLDNGLEMIVDENGARATTPELAIQEALEVIAEMCAAGEVAGNWELVIRDAEGSTVKRLPIECRSPEPARHTPEWASFVSASGAKVSWAG